MLILRELVKDYAFVALMAFLLSAILTPFVRKRCQQRNIFDFPTEARRIHITPIPRLGGIAIYIAFFLSLFTILLTKGRAFTLFSRHLDILGSGDEMDGAMQQAPHPGRHFIRLEWWSTEVLRLLRTPTLQHSNSSGQSVGGRRFAASEQLPDSAEDFFDAAPDFRHQPGEQQQKDDEQGDKKNRVV